MNKPPNNYPFFSQKFSLNERISLNLTNLKEFYTKIINKTADEEFEDGFQFIREYNLTFDEFIAQVITHESVHHLLLLEHDWYTCHRLDNLLKKNPDLRADYMRI